jgi:hypothetical protein
MTGLSTGGRSWWAHAALTRVNIDTPTILCKQIEEPLTVGAFSRFSDAPQSLGAQLTNPA